MRARLKKSAKYLAAILSVAALLSGCGGGIAHKNVVDPTFSSVSAPDLSAIGQATSMRSYGGTLFVGGTTGIAAVSDKGQVLWTLQLPQATVRNIEADADGIAFTTFDLANVDQSSIATSGWLIGNIADKPEFKNANIGMVTTDGKLAWSVPSSEQTRLSPPALSSNAVGVTRSKSFVLLNRKDGSQIAETSMYQNLLFGITDGMFLQSASTRPAVLNNEFFTTHFNFFKKVSAEGTGLASHENFGLFTPFEYITAGPVAFKSKIIFANHPSAPGKKPLMFAATAKGDEDWNEKLDDEKSAPGSIATNAQNVFVATNFMITAFTDSGKEVWTAKNGAGGLFPGSHRGVKFIGNAFSKNFPVPKSLVGGNQMIATDEYVFVTSSYAKGDALTVLDAKTGDYVKSINLKAHIIDMATFASMLALATDDGMKFIAQK